MALRAVEVRRNCIFWAKNHPFSWISSSTCKLKQILQWIIFLYTFLKLFQPLHLINIIHNSLNGFLHKLSLARRCRALPGTDDGSGVWFPYGWPGGRYRYSFKPVIVLKDASGYKLQENMHFTRLGQRQNPTHWTCLKGYFSVPPENRQNFNLVKYSLVTYHWTLNLMRNRYFTISIVQILI